MLAQKNTTSKFFKWSEEREATPQVKKLAKEVQDQVELMTNKQYSMFDALKYMEMEVVGMAYRVKVQTNEEEYIHVLIFYGVELPAKIVVFEVWEDKSLTDPLLIKD